MFENLQRFLAETIVNRLTPEQQEVSLREIRERMMRHTLAANRLQADLFDQAITVLEDKYNEGSKSNRSLYLGNSVYNSSSALIELQYSHWVLISGFSMEKGAPPVIVESDKCYIKMESDNSPLSDHFRKADSLVISRELDSKGNFSYRLAHGWERFRMESFFDRLRPFPDDYILTGRDSWHYLNYGLVDDPEQVKAVLEKIVDRAPKWRPVKLTPV